MIVYFDFQDGAGWENVTAYISPEIRIRSRAMSDSFKYAVNYTSFTIRYNAALFARLRAETEYVLVQIREDDDTTNLFTGEFLPAISTTYNGLLYTQNIELEVEDYTHRLDTNIAEFVKEDYPILAHTGNSLVHSLFTAAGVSTSLISTSVSISTNVEAVALQEDSNALEFLSTIMYEYGWVPNWDENGLFKPIKWIQASGATPVFTFNEDNISIEVEESTAQIDDEALKLYWYGLGERTNTIVYTEDTPYDEDGNFEGVAVLHDTFYPEEANVIDDTTGTYQKVYQEYEDSGIKFYQSRYGVAEGYDQYSPSFAVEHSDFTKLLITKNHVLYTRKDDSLVVETEEYNNSKARIRLANYTAGSLYLYYLHINADVTFTKSQSTVLVEYVTGTQKIQEYDTKFIYTQADADTLAKAMSNALWYGKHTYSFPSDEYVAEGALVAIVTNSGINTTGIVMEREYDAITEAYTYEVKQIIPTYQAVSARTTRISALASSSVASRSTLATEQISAISSDSYLTPSEKITTRAQWTAVVAEKSTLDAEADTYAVSRVAYDAAFQTLANYLNGGSVWSSGWPLWINDTYYTTTTAVVGATYLSTWQAYYTARDALKTAITAAVNAEAEAAAAAAAAAQADADTAISNAHAATRMVTISAASITRSRAGVLSPATLAVASKYGDDGTAYAGRFSIANSTDGVTWDIDYGIPNDPAGRQYLWPKTSVDWSMNNGTLVLSSSKLIYTATTGDSNMYRLFSFAGGTYNKIYLRVKQTAGTINPLIVVYYSTGSHGYSGSYYKNVSGAIPAIGTDYVIAIDMSVLTAGGTDWTSNTITGIRLDLGNVTAQAFEISEIYVGNAATLWYRSAANESSYTCTVPVSSLGSFVVSTRVRLYEAGGFTIGLDEKIAGITADSNTAPLYWGALTTAPTSNVVANDYYFDNNIPESGGGVIRYWSGTAWVQATSAWTYWATAWKTAIADATTWATDNSATLADVSAFMTAIIENAVIKNGIIDYLATSTQVSTALCEDGVTRRMETDWDNAVTTMRSGDQDEVIEMVDGQFTSYSGIGAARRALRHSGASLGWYDSPVGGVESLVARLSRGADSSNVILGDGIEYLMKSDSLTTKTLPTNMYRYTSAIYDGNLYMPQSNGTTLEIYNIAAGTTTTKTLPTNMSRGTCFIYDGNLYMPQSNGTTLEIYNIAAGTTTTKTLPTSMSRNTCFIYDGNLYMPQNNGTTLEIYNIAAGTTTTKTLPTNMLRYASAIYDGNLYMPQSNGTTLEIYNIAAGTTTTKTLPTNMSRGTSAIYDGNLYMPQSNGTTLEIYNIAAGTTTTKTLPTNMSRDTSAIYDGNLYMPRDNGTTLEIYNIAAGTTTTKTLPTNMYRYTCSVYDGNLYMPQYNGTTLELYTFATPCQVGAGIIEAGSNANGSYIKFSDGTMECWGDSSTLITTATASASICYGAGTFSFPATFYAAPSIRNVFLSASINALLVWGGQINTISTTGFTCYLLGNSTSASGYLGYHVIGRWKA